MDPLSDVIKVDKQRPFVVQRQDVFLVNSWRIVHAAQQGVTQLDRFDVESGTVVRLIND